MFIKTSRHLSAQDSASKLASSASSIQSQLLHASHEQTQLLKRQYIGGYGYGYGGSGHWSSYGRWILLGVIVGLAILIWLMVCCCNRRRTRTGMKPVRYTGWATPGYSHAQQSGVVANQPISEPMQPSAYSAQNVGANQPGYYPSQGYNQPPQMSQAYGTSAPINNTYNDGVLPPQYPAASRKV